MPGLSPTMRFLTSCAREEPQVIRWGVSVLRPLRNVFDYLVKTAACNQTREAIDNFLKRSEKFKLAKAEKLNIINLRPSELPLIYPIIEYCDQRFTRNDDRDDIQNLVDLVLDVLPDPPSKPEEESVDPQEEMQTGDPAEKD